MKTIVLIIALGLTLSGCSSQILRTTTPPSPSSEPEIGVIYYLPKALIPITVALNDAPSSGSSKGETTKTNATSAQTQSLTNNITIHNSTGPQKPDDQVSPQPSSPPKKYYEVTVGEPKIIPDTKEPYFLKYNGEPITDDVVSIGVGANHLLQTTNSLSTDQSGKVAVLLAKLAIDVAKMVFQLPVGDASGLPAGASRERAAANRCESLESVKINTYLDLTVGDGEGQQFSLENLNERLKRTPIKFGLKPDICPVGNSSVAKPEPDCLNARPKFCDKNIHPDKQPGCINTKAGVLFRSLKEYKLTMTISETNNLEPGQKWCDVTFDERDVSILAPNNGTVYSVDVSRAPFVAKKTNLTIVDGMLNKIEIDKPSSVIGGLMIPVEIVQAIINIPSELLTLRIKKIQDEGALSKAEGDLLLNEIQKLKNEKSLLQEKGQEPAGTQ